MLFINILVLLKRHLHNYEYIWVHCVSMGEFRAAIVLIDALIKAYPNHKILVTSTTPTGSKAVSEQYQNKILHYYFPFDISFIVCVVKVVNFWYLFSERSESLALTNRVGMLFLCSVWMRFGQISVSNNRHKSGCIFLR
jgi:hypothetical protein